MNYILVAIFLWCNVSSLHCIFGVMYMHFWYAMHRQLCWCLVGVITIVQCIFGALFLGLGCNIFLVLRLWCYALSAISRRLATAVAHQFYINKGTCFSFLIFNFFHKLFCEYYCWILNHLKVSFARLQFAMTYTLYVCICFCELVCVSGRVGVGVFL